MRRSDREIRDLPDILGIIDEAKVLRLGLMNEQYPYIVPMHFGCRCEDGFPVFYPKRRGPRPNNGSGVGECAVSCLSLS